MYYVDRKVGFSESGPDYKIKLTKILDLFQDTCIGQSEEVGVGATAMKEMGYVWVLSSWQVVINRYPNLDEKIIVGTAPYEFRGFFGSRNFVIKTEAGEILAVANSLWSFLDINTQSLARVPEEVSSSYELIDKLEMDYAPRKIKLPENMVAMEPIPVMYHHLDPNDHVNNAQYIAIAEDLIPEGRRARQLRAEYRASARGADTFYPYIHMNEEEGIYTVSLANENGDPFVIVEFSI